MKNREGFTLIELLAIIVILAIIAIITVPIILNVIDNAKIGAIQDSAYGYKDAVSKFYITKVSEDSTYDLTGIYTVDQLKSLGVSVSGNEPIGGFVELEKGIVIDYALKFNEYIVIYDKEENKQEIINSNSVEKPTMSMQATSYNSGAADIVVSASGATKLTYYYYIKEHYGSSDFNLVYKGNESNYTIDNLNENILYDIKVVVEDEYGNEVEDIAMVETFCFVAGTKVHTENGYVNIEDIKIGDMVYAIDLETNEQQLKEVLDTYISYGNELYHMTIDGEIVSSTPRHQFYIVDKGWVRAYDLKIGDQVITKDGLKTITEIQHEYLEEKIPVYNFKVDGLHNYLVTEYSILVHNAGSVA